MIHSMILMKCQTLWSRNCQRLHKICQQVEMTQLDTNLVSLKLTKLPRLIRNSQRLPLCKTPSLLTHCHISHPLPSHPQPLTHHNPTPFTSVPNYQQSTQRCQPLPPKDHTQLEVKQKRTSTPNLQVPFPHKLRNLIGYTQLMFTHLGVPFPPDER